LILQKSTLDGNHNKAFLLAYLTIKHTSFFEHLILVVIIDPEPLEEDLILVG
jgi:hypothetical protein